MRKQRGFSLIELLIVVAIILIIAAIAIPNLMRARMSANEASAVGSVRSINTAEILYNAAYSNLGFATTLSFFGGPAARPAFRRPAAVASSIAFCQGEQRAATGLPSRSAQARPSAEWFLRTAFSQLQRPPTKLAFATSARSKTQLFVLQPRRLPPPVPRPSWRSSNSVWRSTWGRVQAGAANESSLLFVFLGGPSKKLSIRILH